jgi:hypothetical protein
MPGHIVPSTTGRWAIVEACPSSGYSGHLMSERKTNTVGVQANDVSDRKANAGVSVIHGEREERENC